MLCARAIAGYQSRNRDPFLMISRAGWARNRQLAVNLENSFIRHDSTKHETMIQNQTTPPHRENYSTFLYAYFVPVLN